MLKSVPYSLEFAQYLSVATSLAMLPAAKTDCITEGLEQFCNLPFESAEQMLTQDPIFSSTIDKTYEDDLRMVHVAGRHVRNSLAFKASRIAILAGMLAGFVLLTHWLNKILSLFLKTDHLALLAVIVSAVPIIFVVSKLLRFQFVHTGARNLRKIRAEEPETYEIGPTGIRVEGAGLSMNIEWRSIFSIVERPGFVAVLLGCSAIAIPARAFANAAERQEVIDYILDKLPEDARKRSICRKPA